MRVEWKRRLLAVVFSMLIFPVGEGVLRLSGYTHPVREVGFRFVGFDDAWPNYVRDPRLFWRIIPGSREIGLGPAATGVNNDAGFRGALVPQDRRPEVARLAFLGDSSTYGVGVTLQESYVELVGSRITRDLERPVDVMNRGVPGYSSFQGLRLLDNEVLRLRPDVLTLYFGAWNDFTPAIGGDDTEKGRPSAASAWLGTLHQMVQNLRVVMVVAHLLNTINRRMWPESCGKALA